LSLPGDFVKETGYTNPEQLITGSTTAPRFVFNFHMAHYTAPNLPYNTLNTIR
jgi:hypothetical protein